MSRNSKNARLTAARKNNRHATFNKVTGKSESTGNKGPSQTTPAHGKKRAWFQQYDSHGEYMASQKKGAKRPRREDDEESSADAKAK